MSRALPAAAATAVVLALTACGSAAPTSGSSPGVIAVSSTSDSCLLSVASAPAGATVFAVRNDGDAVTEFYVYASDGERVVGEVENVGPGITRELTVVLEAGAYETACKPGATGDGIRAPFTVAGSLAVGAADAAALKAAAARYKVWVLGEGRALLDGTREFTDAVKAGDFEAAKALYADTRMHWERIEPVAESFEELDARLDARENDVPAGVVWTGWHRIEKALWEGGSTAGLSKLATQLYSDTQLLTGQLITVQLTADQVTNGAKALLDEVATGKVTGEEERYSHTDLWDFQGNLDGARKAFDVVAPLVSVKDPVLTDRLTQAFTELQAAMDSHRTADGFVLYTELTPEQVKDLAAKVDALSEPLSQLTAAVVT